MKSKVLPFLLLLQCFFYACNNGDKKESAKSENDIDAARNFIRAALDGNFDKARTYMLDDTVNTQFLDAVERNYRKMQPDAINSYRSASIRIYSPVVNVNDSTSIVVYSNSFKNDQDTLRIVHLNGEWLVDLKYLFQHDMDTLMQQRILVDSIK